MPPLTSLVLVDLSATLSLGPKELGVSQGTREGRLIRMPSTSSWALASSPLDSLQGAFTPVSPLRAVPVPLYGPLKAARSRVRPVYVVPALLHHDPRPPSSEHYSLVRSLAAKSQLIGLESLGGYPDAVIEIVVVNWNHWQTVQ